MTTIFELLGLILLLFSYSLYRRKDKSGSRIATILGLSSILIAAIILNNVEMIIFLVVFILLKVLELIEFYRRKRKQFKRLKDGEERPL